MHTGWFLYLAGSLHVLGVLGGLFVLGGLWGALRGLGQGGQLALGSR